MLLGDFRCVITKFSRAWMFFFIRKRFRLATLPHSPDTWRVREIVVTCTTQSVLARYSCSSFNVAVGLLAASLPNFLLVFSSILQRHPVLGNVTVVRYFLHLMITVFTVLRGISNPLEIPPTTYCITNTSTHGRPPTPPFTDTGSGTPPSALGRMVFNKTGPWH